MNTRISLWVTDTGRWKKHRSQAFKEILDETNYHCSTYAVNSSYEWNGRFVDRLGFDRTRKNTGRLHWKEILENAAVSQFSGFVKILSVQRILLMTDCFQTEKVGEMHGIV